MDNIDWGEKFERILTYSFGYPKTSIYFANYYTQLKLRRYCFLFV